MPTYWRPPNLHAKKRDVSINYIHMLLESPAQSVTVEEAYAKLKIRSENVFVSSTLRYDIESYCLRSAMDEYKFPPRKPSRFESWRNRKAKLLETNTTPARVMETPVVDTKRMRTNSVTEFSCLPMQKFQSRKIEPIHAFSMSKSMP
jgi:hypothetical protein